MVISGRSGRETRIDSAELPVLRCAGIQDGLHISSIHIRTPDEEMVSKVLAELASPRSPFDGKQGEILRNLQRLTVAI